MDNVVINIDEIRDEFINSLSSHSSERTYLMIFKKVIPFEEKYNTRFEYFNVDMLLDFIQNDLKSVSKNSIFSKFSFIKKYLTYVNNNNVLLINTEDLLDSVTTENIKHISYDELVQLCENRLINASDKCMIMLVFHTIKGKSGLEELRLLKSSDINLILRTIKLPNRTITIEDDYTRVLLNRTVKERTYRKYLDDDKDNYKTKKEFDYNFSCPYLFKSSPSKRNNEGLSPMSFSGLTNRLFRLTKILDDDLTVQSLYQSGCVHLVKEYEKKIGKQLSINEVETYLKDVLNIPSVFAYEIYNLKR